MAKNKPAMEVRKIFSMSSDMAERISDYRHENRIGTEAEAIRMLIDLGLKAVGK